jgi:hypothetical protein
MWRRGALALLVAPVALAACGRDVTGDLPSACRFQDGSRTVRAALAAAPGQVRIDGTPLSHCLVREADVGDVQSVGATYVAVASDLADAARRQPHGPAATQLGYLVGAVRRGASKTAGIYYELERRVELELNGVDVNAAGFLRGEREGAADG